MLVNGHVYLVNLQTFLGRTRPVAPHVDVVQMIMVTNGSEDASTNELTKEFSAGLEAIATRVEAISIGLEATFFLFQSILESSCSSEFKLAQTCLTFNALVWAEGV